MSLHPDLSIPLTPLQKYHIYNRGNEERIVFFKKGDYSRFLYKYKEYMFGFVNTYSYCLLENHFHLFFGLRSGEEIIKRAQEVGFGKVNSLFYRRYVLPWFIDIENFDSGASGVLGLTVLPIWKEVDIHKLLPELENYTVGELAELLNQAQPPATERIFEQTNQHPAKLEDLSPMDQLASYIVSERFRRFLLSYSKMINLENNKSGSLFQKAFRRRWLPAQPEWKNTVTFIHQNPIHHHLVKDYHSYAHSSFQAMLSSSKTALERSIVHSWFGSIDEMLNYHNESKNHNWNKESFYMEDFI